ncbi:unnamed protein product [marine sediment metagenome]|uniref:Uncharacterized protein n=1 Tax=marine sediment metagenome TaxID=412755 RepID=X1BYS5_9ZZZZ
MRKTITVEESTWKKLTKAKYTIGCDTVGEVIDRMFKIINKIEKEKNSDCVFAKRKNPNDNTKF